MFFHLVTHVVTGEVLKQSGRVRSANGIDSGLDATRVLLAAARLLVLLTCCGLLLCWLVQWPAYGPAMSWKAAAASEAGFILTAITLYEAWRESRWLRRLGWLSILLQFAAALAFAAWLGRPPVHDRLAELARAGLLFAPALEILAVDLYCYHSARLSKFESVQRPEKAFLEDSLHAD